MHSVSKIRVSGAAAVRRAAATAAAASRPASVRAAAVRVAAVPVSSSSSLRALHTARAVASPSPSAAAGSRAGAKFDNPYANARAPNAAELKILASTVPVLAQHGLTLTTRFYQKMFNKYPQLKNIFNAAHFATGMQPKALAEAVYAYAANIENLGALGPAVAHMANKHASLSILPEHYPLVGSNLLETLDELLTEAGFARKTIDDIIAAWTVAYAQLANILITTEEELYCAAESAPGGWRGWRKFEVTERVEETAPGSNVGPIVSFTLKPKDGGAVPAYLPGQYTTVLATLPPGMGGTTGGESMTQPRQYSLSKAADNKSFRITVKREDPLPSAVSTTATKAQCPFSGGKAAHGSLAGVVSSWVHSNLSVGSEVQLAPPFGEFVLKEGKNPVVLLAAGVGITPLVPMLETAAANGRRVSLLYATHSSNKHPLRSWFAGCRASGAKVSAAASSVMADAPAATIQGAGRGDVTLKVWYEAPEISTDVLGVTHDYTGRIELDKLSDKDRQQLLALDAKPDFYVCGPPQFMQAQLAQLRKLGVPESNLHAEVFGAGGCK